MQHDINVNLGMIKSFNESTRASTFMNVNLTPEESRVRVKTHVA